MSISLKYSTFKSSNILLKLYGGCFHKKKKRTSQLIKQNCIKNYTRFDEK